MGRGPRARGPARAPMGPSHGTAATALHGTPLRDTARYASARLGTARHGPQKTTYPGSALLGTACDWLGTARHGET